MTIILNTTEQHFLTSLNGVLSFSISCFVLGVLRFFETCKLAFSDAIYSRITNFIYKMTNIYVNNGQNVFKLCMNIFLYWDPESDLITPIFKIARLLG